MIAIKVYVLPHERREAIEAYRERLTQAHADEIEDAPDGALIQLTIIGPGALVTVIEEEAIRELDGDGR